MTQLKDVYGIITFEQYNIKISVYQVEKQVKHCLYFRSIFLLDSFQDHVKSHRDAVIRYLRNELMKVETFIGVNVLRYLILVPDLKMTLNNKLSDEVSFHTKEQLDNYLKNLSTPDGKVCLNRSITDYIVNEQVQSEMPTQDVYKVNYIEYLANKADVTELCNLIDALQIEPLGFYNNAIAYKNSILDHNKKTRILIDMLDDCTNIYFYDKNTELYRIVTVEEGKDWLINQLTEITKLTKEQCINFISAYQNIKLINENPIILNCHCPHYRSLKQLDLNSFKVIVNNLINKYFQIIVDKCDSIDCESVHFNCDNSIYDCFDYKLNVCQEAFINGVKIETQYQTIVGLEHENVANIIWILNGAINENELLGKAVPCSIDPYFDEHQQERQFNKDIFMKFGIFLTNFVAKLGGSMDQIWKKS